MSINKNLYIEDTFNQTKDIRINLDHCITFQPKQICIKTENTKITKYFSIKYIHFIQSSEIIFKISCLNPEIHFRLKLMIQIPEVHPFGAETHDIEFIPDIKKRSSTKIIYLHTFEEVYQHLSHGKPEVLFRFFFANYTPLDKMETEQPKISSSDTDIPVPKIDLEDIDVVNSISPSPTKFSGLKSPSQGLKNAINQIKSKNSPQNKSTQNTTSSLSPKQTLKPKNSPILVDSSSDSDSPSYSSSNNNSKNNSTNNSDSHSDSYYYSDNDTTIISKNKPNTNSKKFKKISLSQPKSTNINYHILSDNSSSDYEFSDNNTLQNNKNMNNKNAQNNNVQINNNKNVQNKNVQNNKNIQNNNKNAQNNNKNDQNNNKNDQNNEQLDLLFDDLSDFNDVNIDKNNSEKMTTDLNKYQASEIYNGIINQGTTSPLNCMLQVLFHLPLIRKTIYDIDTTKNESDFSLQLQHLFLNLQFNKSPADTKNLAQIIGWNDINSSEQNNINELFGFLLEQIQQCTGENLNNIFKGERIRHFYSKKNEKKIYYEDEFFNLSLDIFKNSTLFKSLRSNTMHQSFHLDSTVSNLLSKININSQLNIQNQDKIYKKILSALNNSFENESELIGNSLKDFLEKSSDHDFFSTFFSFLSEINTDFNNDFENNFDNDFENDFNNDFDDINKKNSIEIETWQEYLSFPQILQVNLNRSYNKGLYNLNTYSRFDFPENLDISQLLSKRNNHKGSKTYQLTGILVRKETKYFNIYCAYLLPDPIEEKQWYKFYDSSVSRVQINKVIDSSAIGSDGFSAFMLIYVQSDAIYNVYFPILYTSLYQHLQNYILQFNPSVKLNSEFSSELNSNNSMLSNNDNLNANNDKRFKSISIITDEYLNEKVKGINIEFGFPRTINQKKWQIKINLSETKEQIYKKIGTIFNFKPGSFLIYKIWNDEYNGKIQNNRIELLLKESDLDKDISNIHLNNIILYICLPVLLSSSGKSSNYIHLNQEINPLDFRYQNLILCYSFQYGKPDPISFMFPAILKPNEPIQTLKSLSDSVIDASTDSKNFIFKVSSSNNHNNNNNNNLNNSNNNNNLNNNNNNLNNNNNNLNNNNNNLNNNNNNLNNNNNNNLNNNNNNLNNNNNNPNNYNNNQNNSNNNLNNNNNNQNNSNNDQCMFKLKNNMCYVVGEQNKIMEMSLAENLNSSNLFGPPKATISYIKLLWSVEPDQIQESPITILNDLNHKSKELIGYRQLVPISMPNDPINYIKIIQNEEILLNFAPISEPTNSQKILISKHLPMKDLYFMLFIIFKLKEFTPHTYILFFEKKSPYPCIKLIDSHYDSEIPINDILRNKFSSPLLYFYIYHSPPPSSPTSDQSPGNILAKAIDVMWNVDGNIGNTRVVCIEGNAYARFLSKARKKGMPSSKYPIHVCVIKNLIIISEKQLGKEIDFSIDAVLLTREVQKPRIQIVPIKEKQIIYDSSFNLSQYSLNSNLLNLKEKKRVKHIPPHFFKKIENEPFYKMKKRICEFYQIDVISYKFYLEKNQYIVQDNDIINDICDDDELILMLCPKARLPYTKN